MKNYQNQLDRFRVIAKKLVDEHSAELFSSYRLSTDLGVKNMADDAYHSHLDILGRQLTERAQDFIKTTRTNADTIKTEVMGLCNKYLDLFAKLNQPE
ncbi:MAG: hypothetical protein JST82_04990 [Bacteroidetes bacterium]|nr:hypothetical protein [Bacteroidota bacterium]